MTTLASPLAGTTLAQTPLARLVTIDSLGDLLRAPASLLLLRGPNAILRAADGVLNLFGQDAAVERLVSAALHSGKPGASYVVSLLLTRALIAELRPRSVTRLMTQTREDPELSELPRFRFLTVARRRPQSTAAGRLFDWLYESTASEAEPNAALALVERRLDATPVPVIGKLPVPELGPAANDGVVNTLRQIPPCTEHTVERELARVSALVIADHIDVVGYFPGKDGRDAGFLSSGSHFREPEFRKLYAAVAGGIARVIGAQA